MNNSPVEVPSNVESENSANVLLSPLWAGTCLAICLFSAINAFFFGVWIRLVYLIASSEFLNSFNYYLAETWRLIERGTFLNLFILVTACFAGYLLIGSLNKWIGIISLLVTVFLAGLYLITFLPFILGIDFIPVVFYHGVYGNTSIMDIPLLIWFFLSFLIIPVIYLVGSIKAKTIPLWKWLVLAIVPLITCVFGLFPGLFLAGVNNRGFMYWLSWGMSVWILFAVVIFSELLRTKVSKSYIWLTLIQSTLAVILSITVISIFSFYIYQRTIEYKKRTGLELRTTETGT
jgi:hypothetical protein